MNDGLSRIQKMTIRVRQKDSPIWPQTWKPDEVVEKSFEGFGLAFEADAVARSLRGKHTTERSNADYRWRIAEPSQSPCCDNNDHGGEQNLISRKLILDSRQCETRRRLHPTREYGGCMIYLLYKLSCMIEVNADHTRMSRLKISPKARALDSFDFAHGKDQWMLIFVVHITHSPVSIYIAIRQHPHSPSGVQQSRTL